MPEPAAQFFAEIDASLPSSSSRGPTNFNLTSKPFRSAEVADLMRRKCAIALCFDYAIALDAMGPSR